MKAIILAVLALLCSTVHSVCFMESGNELENGSYYNDAFIQTGEESNEEPNALYYHCYNYYCYYYDDGPTVAFIIFVDILIPIGCCIGVTITIICVIRHIKMKRMREAEIQRQQLIDA